ncbi:MAG TPA: Holliday junction resolvase RuvX [Firmicutes bacterium]|nr:Holliday junction resolvase RuvX [Bacillota bacterium]
MRIMGLDLGQKRIGVALSDPMLLTATAHTVIPRRGLAEDIHRICALVEEYDVGEIVVGLPVRTTGEEGPEAALARGFAERLAEQCSQVKVSFFDERFTTVIAERVLIEGNVRRKKRREVIDQLAAAVMLQNYLDYRKKGRESSE